MESLASPDLWGAPLGMAFLFLGLGVGLGGFFWGIANLVRAQAAKAEVELKERQFHYERKQGEA